MSKLEKEAALEARCVQKVETAGGLALKLSIPGVRGFPDRSCLLPGGRVFFVEIKRLRTGVVSKQQHRWRALLFQAGFNTYFVSTDAEFDEALAKEMVR